MGRIDILNLLVGMAGLLSILLYRGRIVEVLIEAIENFRGGPPGPMHPSPSNDGRLLCRKRRKMED